MCCMKNWLKGTVHRLVVNGENTQSMNLRNNQKKSEDLFYSAVICIAAGRAFQSAGKVASEVMFFLFANLLYLVPNIFLYLL